MEVLLCLEEMEPDLHPEVPGEVVGWGAAGLAPGQAVTVSARAAVRRCLTSWEHHAIKGAALNAALQW
jgi:hypothetical protein